MVRRFQGGRVCERDDSVWRGQLASDSHAGEPGGVSPRTGSASGQVRRLTPSGSPDRLAGGATDAATPAPPNLPRVCLFQQARAAPWAIESGPFGAKSSGCGCPRKKDFRSSEVSEDFAVFGRCSGPSRSGELGDDFIGSPRLLELERSTWRRSLSTAIRDVATLLRELELPEEWAASATEAVKSFPVLVPRSFLARMRVGDPHDPLLRQVLPVPEEGLSTPGFVIDVVDDQAARVAPGLLHKYEGRVLLIAAGSCAVNCRYCFRRHYPYGEEPRRLDDWEPAILAIEQNSTIHEVILSGGDPLLLPDERLAALVERLERIEHLTRLRIHSRLPIVLPDRVNSELIELLRESRLQPIMVVHANHPHEIAKDCEEALRRLVRSGIPTLNQAVLLRGVNDDADVLADLCERLVDLGVLPYYLHQLDRVAGTAHFEVPEATGLELMAELRKRLPGYAVPQYVREVAGDASKTPILSGA